MTLDSFRRLSPLTQFCWVQPHGTFLASRFEATAGINLYHCQEEERGFFVEMSLAIGTPFVVRSELLEVYVQGI